GAKAGSHAGPIPCGCGQIPRSCEEPVAASRTGDLKPSECLEEVADRDDLGFVQQLLLSQVVRLRNRRSRSPPATCAGRCCSPMRALTTSTAPVRAGMIHC